MVVVDSVSAVQPPRYISELLIRGFVGSLGVPRLLPGLKKHSFTSSSLPASLSPCLLCLPVFLQVECQNY